MSFGDKPMHSKFAILGGAPIVLLEFLPRFMPSTKNRGKNFVCNTEEFLKEIQEPFSGKITGESMGDILYQSLEEILDKSAEEIAGVFPKISPFKVPPKFYPDFHIFCCCFFFLHFSRNCYLLHFFPYFFSLDFL